jgi:hypothetical protein
MEESPKSPREEALQIANETRKNILDKNKDVVSILRACFIVADMLNKDNDKDWIVSELQGYRGEVPGYRIVSCNYEDESGRYHNEFRDFNVSVEAPMLDSQLRRDKDLRLGCGKRVAIVNPFKLERIISPILDRCLFFLTKVLQELRYGSMIASIVDEIRNEVDEKLIGINKEISVELNSVYLNLSSGTSAVEWSHVSTSCRRILKILADDIFPPKEELHIGRDGKSYSVKSDDYINRICAFVDENSTGDDRRLLTAETKYLASYLEQIDEMASKGVHGNITKFQASMVLTHMYLIISDIIRILETKKPNLEAVKS